MFEKNDPIFQKKLAALKKAVADYVNEVGPTSPGAAQKKNLDNAQEIQDKLEKLNDNEPAKQEALLKEIQNLLKTLPQDVALKKALDDFVTKSLLAGAEEAKQGLEELKPKVIKEAENLVDEAKNLPKGNTPSTASDATPPPIAQAALGQNERKKKAKLPLRTKQGNHGDLVPPPVPSPDPASALPPQGDKGTERGSNLALKVPTVPSVPGGGTREQQAVREKGNSEVKKKTPENEAKDKSSTDSAFDYVDSDSTLLIAHLKEVGLTLKSLEGFKEFVSRNFIPLGSKDVLREFISKQATSTQKASFLAALEEAKIMYVPPTIGGQYYYFKSDVKKEVENKAELKVFTGITKALPTITKGKYKLSNDEKARRQIVRSHQASLKYKTSHNENILEALELLVADANQGVVVPAYDLVIANSLIASKGYEMDLLLDKHRNSEEDFYLTDAQMSVVVTELTRYCNLVGLMDKMDPKWENSNLLVNRVALARSNWIHYLSTQPEFVRLHEKLKNSGKDLVVQPQSDASEKEAKKLSQGSDLRKRRGETSRFGIFGRKKPQSLPESNEDKDFGALLLEVEEFKKDVNRRVYSFVRQGGYKQSRNWFEKHGLLYTKALANKHLSHAQKFELLTNLNAAVSRIIFEKAKLTTSEPDDIRYLQHQLKKLQDGMGQDFNANKYNVIKKVVRRVLSMNQKGLTLKKQAELQGFLSHLIPVLNEYQSDRFYESSAGIPDANKLDNVKFAAQFAIRMCLEVQLDLSLLETANGVLSKEMTTAAQAESKESLPLSDQSPVTSLPVDTAEAKKTPIAKEGKLERKQEAPAVDPSKDAQAEADAERKQEVVSEDSNGIAAEASRILVDLDKRDLQVDAIGEQVLSEFKIKLEKVQKAALTGLHKAEAEAYTAMLGDIEGELQVAKEKIAKRAAATQAPKKAGELKTEKKSESKDPAQHAGYRMLREEYQKYCFELDGDKSLDVQLKQYEKLKEQYKTAASELKSQESASQNAKGTTVEREANLALRKARKNIESILRDKKSIATTLVTNIESQQVLSMFFSSRIPPVVFENSDAVTAEKVKAVYSILSDDAGLEEEKRIQVKSVAHGLAKYHNQAEKEYTEAPNQETQNKFQEIGETVRDLADYILKARGIDSGYHYVHMWRVLDQLSHTNVNRMQVMLEENTVGEVDEKRLEKFKGINPFKKTSSNKKLISEMKSFSTGVRNLDNAMLRYRSEKTLEAYMAMHQPYYSVITHPCYQELTSPMFLQIFSGFAREARKANNRKRTTEMKDTYVGILRYKKIVNDLGALGLREDLAFFNLAMRENCDKNQLAFLDLIANYEVLAQDSAKLSKKDYNQLLGYYKQIAASPYLQESQWADFELVGIRMNALFPGFTQNKEQALLRRHLKARSEHKTSLFSTQIEAKSVSQKIAKDFNEELARWSADFENLNFHLEANPTFKDAFYNFLRKYHEKALNQEKGFDLDVISQFVLNERFDITLMRDQGDPSKSNDDFLSDHMDRFFNQPINDPIFFAMIGAEMSEFARTKAKQSIIDKKNAKRRARGEKFLSKNEKLQITVTQDDYLPGAVQYVLSKLEGASAEQIQQYLINMQAYSKCSERWVSGKLALSATVFLSSSAEVKALREKVKEPVASAKTNHNATKAAMRFLQTRIALRESEREANGIVEELNVLMDEKPLKYGDVNAAIAKLEGVLEGAERLNKNLASLQEEHFAVDPSNPDVFAPDDRAHAIIQTRKQYLEALEKKPSQFRDRMERRANQYLTGRVAQMRAHTDDFNRAADLKGVDRLVREAKTVENDAKLGSVHEALSTPRVDQSVESSEAIVVLIEAKLEAARAERDPANILLGLNEDLPQSIDQVIPDMQNKIAHENKQCRDGMDQAITTLEESLETAQGCLLRTRASQAVANTTFASARIMRDEVIAFEAELKGIEGACEADSAFLGDGAEIEILQGASVTVRDLRMQIHTEVNLFNVLASRAKGAVVAANDEAVPLNYATLREDRKASEHSLKKIRKLRGHFLTARQKRVEEVEKVNQSLADVELKQGELQTQWDQFEIITQLALEAKIGFSDRGLAQINKGEQDDQLIAARGQLEVEGDAAPTMAAITAASAHLQSAEQKNVAASAALQRGKKRYVDAAHNHIKDELTGVLAELKSNLAKLEAKHTADKEPAIINAVAGQVKRVYNALANAGGLIDVARRQEIDGLLRGVHGVDGVDDIAGINDLLVRIGEHEFSHGVWTEHLEGIAAQFNENWRDEGCIGGWLNDTDIEDDIDAYGGYLNTLQERRANFTAAADQVEVAGLRAVTDQHKQHFNAPRLPVRLVGRPVTLNLCDHDEKKAERAIGAYMATIHLLHSELSTELPESKLRELKGVTPEAARKNKLKRLEAIVNRLPLSMPGDEKPVFSDTDQAIIREVYKNLLDADNKYEGYTERRNGVELPRDLMFAFKLFAYCPDVIAAEHFPESKMLPKIEQAIRVNYRPDKLTKELIEAAISLLLNNNGDGLEEDIAILLVEDMVNNILLRNKSVDEAEKPTVNALALLSRHLLYHFKQNHYSRQNQEVALNCLQRVGRALAAKTHLAQRVSNSFVGLESGQPLTEEDKAIGKRLLAIPAEYKKKSHKAVLAISSALQSCDSAVPGADDEKEAELPLMAQPPAYPQADPAVRLIEAIRDHAINIPIGHEDTINKINALSKKLYERVCGLCGEEAALGEEWNALSARGQAVQSMVRRVTQVHPITREAAEAKKAMKALTQLHALHAYILKPANARDAERVRLLRALPARTAQVGRPAIEHKHALGQDPGNDSKAITRMLAPPSTLKEHANHLERLGQSWQYDWQEAIPKMLGVFAAVAEDLGSSDRALNAADVVLIEKMVKFYDNYLGSQGLKNDEDPQPVGRLKEVARNSHDLCRAVWRQAIKVPAPDRSVFERIHKNLKNQADEFSHLDFQRSLAQVAKSYGFWVGQTRKNIPEHKKWVRNFASRGVWGTPYPSLESEEFESKIRQGALRYQFMPKAGTGNRDITPDDLMAENAFDPLLRNLQENIDALDALDAAADELKMDPATGKVNAFEELIEKIKSLEGLVNILSKDAKYMASSTCKVKIREVNQKIFLLKERMHDKMIVPAGGDKEKYKEACFRLPEHEAFSRYNMRDYYFKEIFVRANAYNNKTYAGMDDLKADIDKLDNDMKLLVRQYAPLIRGKSKHDMQKMLKAFFLDENKLASYQQLVGLKKRLIAKREELRQAHISDPNMSARELVIANNMAYFTRGGPANEAGVMAIQDAWNPGDPEFKNINEATEFTSTYVSCDKWKRPLKGPSKASFTYRREASPAGATDYPKSTTQINRVSNQSHRRTRTAFDAILTHLRGRIDAALQHNASLPADQRLDDSEVIRAALAKPMFLNVGSLKDRKDRDQVVKMDSMYRAVHKEIAKEAGLDNVANMGLRVMHKGHEIEARNLSTSRFGSGKVNMASVDKATENWMEAHDKTWMKRYSKSQPGKPLKTVIALAKREVHPQFKELAKLKKAHNPSAIDRDELKFNEAVGNLPELKNEADEVQQGLQEDFNERFSANSDFRKAALSERAEAAVAIIELKQRPPVVEAKMNSERAKVRVCDEYLNVSGKAARHLHKLVEYLAQGDAKVDGPHVTALHAFLEMSKDYLERDKPDYSDPRALLDFENQSEILQLKMDIASQGVVASARHVGPPAARSEGVTDVLAKVQEQVGLAVAGNGDAKQLEAGLKVLACLNSVIEVEKVCASYEDKIQAANPGILSVNLYEANVKGLEFLEKCAEFAAKDDPDQADRAELFRAKVAYDHAKNVYELEVEQGQQAAPQQPGPR